MRFKNDLKWILSLVPGLFFSLSTPVMGADLDRAMNKVVKEMVRVVQQQEMTGKTVTVALFPFQSDKALTRKKVNVAVSEILTQKLLQEKIFKLVERNRLEILLSEQKLGMTGAVESETAAEVGKLLGARLAALGVIAQMGKSYQISVKLVDTATSEIVGAVIVEVPVEIFDREASDYLVLVPEQQAIGLYLEVGLFPGMQVDQQPVQSQWGVTVTPTSARPEAPNAIGLGFRYFPFRHWMIDLYAMHLSVKSDFQPFSASFGDDIVKPDALESNLTGTGIRCTLNKSFSIVNHLCALMGIGAEFMELGHKERVGETIREGENECLIETKNKVAQYFAPLVRVGLEWKVQSRLGLSCFLYGRLADQSHSLYAAILHYNTAEAGGAETIKLKTQKVHLPRLALGLSAVVYF